MKKVILGDVCEKIGSGATPRGGSDVYLLKGEIALIRSQNVYNDGFKTDGLVYITDTHAEELSNVVVEPNDILLNITGDSVARCCQVPENVLPARVNQHVAIIRPQKDKLDARYLRYYLIDPTMQDYMLMLAGGGATRNALTKGMIESFQISLPPLPEQRAIAGVLGALDDKIELNRRMNRTLESMARAVFRHWFVESEKAAGWEEKSLDEIADFLNGLALQKFPAEEGGDYLPVIKIAQLRKNDTKNADKASPNIPTEYVVEDGDILFSWSGSLEVVIWCGGKGALNQHLFKVTSEKYPKWFYYYWTKHHLPDFQEIAAGKATTMGHIQRHHLQDAKVLVPSDKELQEMDKVMSPILEKIICNEKQSRTLAALRDALLPKLMRGEVRVTVHE